MSLTGRKVATAALLFAAPLLLSAFVQPQLTRPAGKALQSAAAVQVLPLGRKVHSFPPTPLFRGVVPADGQAARAEMIFNNRSFGVNAANEPAEVELAMDLVAYSSLDGRKLGEHCVERTFTMEAPLDLKKVGLTLTQTGMRIEWPDGQVDDVQLFQPGEDVEVSILALALRGDGDNQSPIERASLRVQGDLDGDCVLEFETFMGADHQGGTHFTS